MAQRVVIIGGGIIGVCCAFELNRAGHDVILLDAGPIGHGCSFGNSGFIAPGHGPLCTPGAYERAIKSQDDPDAPWYYSDAEPATQRWMEQFKNYCTHEHEAHCLQILDALGSDMINRYTALLDETGIECDFHSLGSEYVAYGSDAVDQLDAESVSMRTRGHDAHLSKPGEEPLAADALQPAWLRTLVLPDGASLNPYRFVCGLTDYVCARGVKILEHKEFESFIRCDDNPSCVAGFHTKEGDSLEADSFVLATGMSTSVILAPFGIDLPLQAAKGYHIDVRVQGRPLERPVILADSDTILTPMDDFIRISGTVEFTGNDDSLQDRRINALYERALCAAPFLNRGEVLSRWLGRRPALPDGLPTIGRVPDTENLFVATGHARLGVSLAPRTAVLVRMLIEGSHDSILDHISIERFAASQSN